MGSWCGSSQILCWLGAADGPLTVLRMHFPFWTRKLHLCVCGWCHWFLCNVFIVSLLCSCGGLLSEVAGPGPWSGRTPAGSGSGHSITQSATALCRKTLCHINNPLAKNPLFLYVYPLRMSLSVVTYETSSNSCVYRWSPWRSVLLNSPHHGFQN